MMDLTKIADSLPTREDVMNAVRMATSRSTPTDVSTMLGVFGAGMLIGAGLALLFAPKTGSELRHDIESRVADLRQNLTQGEGRGAQAPSGATGRAAGPASAYAGAPQGAAI